MTDKTHTQTDDFDIDELDFDALLGDFADVSVDGGFDSSNDDGCEGGACKI